MLWSGMLSATRWIGSSTARRSARLASTSAEPPVLRALREEKTASQERVKELTGEVTALRATIRQLERVIAVLALENEQFKAEAPHDRMRPPRSSMLRPAR